MEDFSSSSKFVLSQTAPRSAAETRSMCVGWGGLCESKCLKLLIISRPFKLSLCHNPGAKAIIVCF